MLNVYQVTLRTMQIVKIFSMQQIESKPGNWPGDKAIIFGYCISYKNDNLNQ